MLERRVAPGGQMPRDMQLSPDSKGTSAVRRAALLAWEMTCGQRVGAQMCHVALCRRDEALMKTNQCASNSSVETQYW